MLWTRLHHHQALRVITEKARKLRARQPRAALDPILAIRYRNFKAALCQIDTDGRSIHHGLLLIGQHRVPRGSQVAAVD